MSLKKRLAIIGCGSSGLITLKMATDFLPDWEIVCFEKTDSIVGCWGNPHPDFVSTSTKFTTQFACFPKFDANVVDDAGRSRSEFFQNDQYGQYLESFADHFNLREHISLGTFVEQLTHEGDAWSLTVDGEAKRYDAVVVCTGLAAKAKSIDCDVTQLPAAELSHPDGLGHIKNQKIVVVGGGESAVDYADRLAKPELNNELLLSLHSGIRVSPRYHPVRGVPSDFLRNRLMLSVHPDIRNYLGQIFVELRIKYERRFRKLFPGNHSSTADESESHRQLRKEWTMRLTAAAKDDLFNMFHNKSDDFLNNVGKGRIRIVGSPTDNSWTSFEAFEADERESISFDPDLVVPGIGFESTLGSLTNDTCSIQDFFLGCCHAKHDNLFAVGFARPIIGNIPTISEMQARLVCSLIAQTTKRPRNIEHLHDVDRQKSAQRFSKLNLNAVYPVEMFPYCDRIAKLMGLRIGPGFFESPLRWWQTKTTPATTMHYFEEVKDVRKRLETSSRHMPWMLVSYILLMKPVDWLWKLWCRVKS